MVKRSSMSAYYYKQFNFLFWRGVEAITVHSGHLLECENGWGMIWSRIVHKSPEKNCSKRHRFSITIHCCLHLFWSIGKCRWLSKEWTHERMLGEHNTNYHWQLGDKKGWVSSSLITLPSSEKDNTPGTRLCPAHPLDFVYIGNLINYAHLLAGPETPFV